MRYVLANGESGADIRTKINNMFQEIYQDLISGLSFRGILTGSETVAGTTQGYYYFVGQYKTGANVYGSGLTTTVNIGDGLFYNGSAWEVLTDCWNRGYAEKLTRADGLPAIGDPISIEEITHNFAGTYTVTPDVIPVNKSGVHIWVKSVSITEVVIGVGTGEAESDGSDFDYDLLVYSNG